MIKFRIWDKIAKKFMGWTDFMAVGTGSDGIFDLSAQINKQSYYMGYNVADNFVIQQFTGTFDKNGKEIYEGDILRQFSFGQPCHPKTDEERAFIKEGKYRKYDSRHVVPTLLSLLHVQPGSYDTQPTTAEWYAEYEVIGNIFENPGETETITLGWENLKR